MKYARACAVLLFLSVCFRLFGGTPETQVESVRSGFNPQRFEFAIESGYLLGAINAPAGYEIGAEFLTGRIRWGVVDGDTWLRGQVGKFLKLPNTVVFVIFDEGSSNIRGGGHTAALALGTAVRLGSRSTALTGHYGILRTIEQAWGLPLLGRSAHVPPITGIWR